MWSVVRTLLAFLLVSPFAVAQPLQLATYDYPPYMHADISPAPPGEHPGPVVELVQEAFRRTGTEINITFYPFQRAKRLVEIGDASGLFTLKKTAERERQYVFSKEPLLLQDYVLYVVQDSALSFDGDLDKLQPASLGIVEATSYGSRFDDYIQSLPAARRDYSNSHEANFRKLIAGRVQMIACSRAVGDLILKRLGAAQKVKVIGPPVETAASYMMFNPAATPAAVITQFDAQLRAMRRDGSSQRIFNKYLN